MNLNVGCGPFPADGWTNTDLVHIDGEIEPDIVVTADNPFPFDTHTVTRAYLGHVLEHVPWHRLPWFLGELRRVLVDGAQIMVVGPDTMRVLDRWKNGDEDWSKVAGIIEGTGAYLTYLGAYEHIRWVGDRHHWNCYEARVVEALELCGFQRVEAFPVTDEGRLAEDRIRAEGWPLVDGSPCQFAVRADAP